MEAQRPLVDVPAVGGRVDHGEPVAADPHGDGAGVLVQVFGHPRRIAESGRHQQVGLGPALQQEFADFGGIADEILRGR